MYRVLGEAEQPDGGQCRLTADRDSQAAWLPDLTIAASPHNASATRMVSTSQGTLRRL